MRVAAYTALGDDVFTMCGVEERAEPRRAEAFADLLNDPPLPGDWFTQLPSGAALHARAGVVRPLAAIRAWLASAQLILESPVAQMERLGEGWLLRASDGRALLKADAVVIACGAALRRFEAARFLPLHLSRGQIEWGRDRHAAAPCSRWRKLRRTLRGRTYLRFDLRSRR
ncbi:MAG: hypothetical protein WDM79_09715 [Terricaulis sp.]